VTPEELAPLRAVLREHYLMQVTCDHEGKRDNPVCNCQRVNLGWHPSIGAAVDAWTDHVLAAAREALARPGGGQERDELIAMAADTADRDEYQLVISEMLAHWEYRLRHPAIPCRLLIRLRVDPRRAVLGAPVLASRSLARLRPAAGRRRPA
jgi:hypothetical protein